MMIRCLQAFTVSTANEIGDVCLIICACACLTLCVYICPQNCSHVVNKLHCNFMEGSTLAKDYTVKDAPSAVNFLFSNLIKPADLFRSSSYPHFKGY